MAKQTLAGLTAEQLRAVLHYDPDTGFFRWREGIFHWRAGLPAGTEAECGPSKRPYVHIVLGTTSKGMQNRRYVLLGIQRRVYRAHRLAWLYVHGRWPENDIDHINGDGCDNRIANLREATTAENAMNRVRRADNTSGIKGVSWNKRSSQWLVHVGFQGKIVHGGLFDTIEEAKAAREALASRLHGEFVCHG
jgi:hypothetical protein